MKKKMLLWTAAILLLTLVGCTATSSEKSQGQGSRKTINIVVKNEDEIVLETTLETTAEVLGDVLEEYQEELKLEMEDSQYGRFIVKMADLSQGENGPWWTYDSEDNTACKAGGMCMGIDEVTVEDGNHFVFTLTFSF